MTILLSVALLVIPAGLKAQAVSNWRSAHGKSPTEFSAAEWRSVIDAAWGPSMTTQEQLDLFDDWWQRIDRQFGAFQDLDFDIVAFRDRYRPEIEAGVSRGRFAAIMNHFGYRLEDLHTYVWDNGVRNTRRAKGVPLLVIGQFSTNQGFGATLTPLEDSTLVVYRALPRHPLGLEAGDVILGYDGILWKDIYPKLMEAELPLFLNPVNASTDQANAYYLLHAAGMNWHLFDTLDVVKYSTGDTLHFDTNLLAAERRVIWGSEHIDVPGVEWPNRSLGDRVSSGIVEGTEIGYVYVTSWSRDSQFDIRSKFRQAVIDLWFTERVKAIIFDFRYNTGGNALAVDAWNLMFDEVTPTIGFDERADPNDHFAMREDPGRREANLVIRPDPQTFWDRPIAVLIGPGSISAGELEARRASFHPRTRIFGLPAAGGNTGSIFPTFPAGSNFFGSMATSSQYLVEGHEYIPRTALEPDERAWHTREAVANGRDAVVEAAIEWVGTQIVTSAEVASRDLPLGLEISAYPNPTRSGATIEFSLEKPAQVSVEVFDAMGRRVADLSSGISLGGAQRICWNGTLGNGEPAPGGAYFIRVLTDRFERILPLVLAR